MARTIDADLLAAQVAALRTPVLRATLSRPGFADDTFDISRYVLSAELTLAPNLAPGYVTMTLNNPGNVISLHPLYQPDYVLDLSMGYLTRYGLRLAQMGRFYIDEPQREFTVNPAKNTVILQARDGVKLYMERNWEVTEWIQLADVSVREALETVNALVTSAGVAPTLVFDEDLATQHALESRLDFLSGSPQDQTDDAEKLFKAICVAAGGLQYFFRGDGTLRVGMMNGVDPADAVATFGGATALRRPIFDRNHRRSGREHFNVVHVEGDRVFGEVEDSARIAAIGRRKYLFVDDPEVDTTERAQRRAQQELDLATRFIEQPDIVTNWMFDVERRDLITIDDENISGLVRDVYRIEDLRYTYTGGATPKADLQLGLGLPNAADTTSTGGSFI